MAAKKTSKAKSASGGKPSKPKLTFIPIKLKYYLNYKWLIIVILLALVYYFRGFIIASVVNGRIITRYSVVRQLEKQSGSAVLDNLINETLILQEARKNGVTVTPEAIAEEIKKLEEKVSAQGQNFDELLSLQGMTREDLESQFRIQKLLEQMLLDSIAVTDEEIDEFLETNAAFLPEGTPEEELRQTARDQLTQQKLSQEFTTWLENLKTNANINNFVEY